MTSTNGPVDPPRVLRVLRALAWIGLAIPLAVGVSAAPLVATPAQAQGAMADEDALSRRAHQYSNGVMSPFCKGRTLNDCPSPNAAMLRDRIKGMMRQGMSDEQIMQELTRTYGDGVMALPRNAMEWAMPVFVLLCGLGGLAFALYRVTQRSAAQRRQVAIPKDLEKRLDAELRTHGF